MQCQTENPAKEIDKRNGYKNWLPSRIKIERRERYGLYFGILTLPFTYHTMKPWAKEKAVRKIQTALHRVKQQKNLVIIDIWYALQLSPYLADLHPVVPLVFLLGMYHEEAMTEEVIIRDGEGAGAFADAVYRDLNALTILTEDVALWEDFAEEAYHQSGLIVQYQYSKPPRVTTKRVCIVDFSDVTYPANLILPQNARYLDIAPTKQKSHMMECKYPDIEYHSYMSCLI
ncbi:MAG: hypothetical protein RR238_06960 [Lachnospiraceae bacterium]